MFRKYMKRRRCWGTWGHGCESAPSIISAIARVAFHYLCALVHDPSQSKNGVSESGSIWLGEPRARKWQFSGRWAWHQEKKNPDEHQDAHHEEEPCLPQVKFQKRLHMKGWTRFLEPVLRGKKAGWYGRVRSNPRGDRVSSRSPNMPKDLWPRGMKRFVDLTSTQVLQLNPDEHQDAHHEEEPCLPQVKLQKRLHMKGWTRFLEPVLRGKKAGWYRCVISNPRGDRVSSRSPNMQKTFGQEE